MIEAKIKQKVKPLLGNNHIQVQDIVKSQKNTHEAKLSNVLLKQNCQAEIDHDRQLYQRLKCKEFGSIETADCEDPIFQDKQVMGNFNESSLEKEKMKLQLQRIEKTKGSRRKTLTQPSQKLDLPNARTLKQIKKDVENNQLKHVLRLSCFLSAHSKK